MKDQHPISQALPDGNRREEILLNHSFCAKKRGFAVFLVCCAMMIAAFAISMLWLESGRDGWFSKGEAPLPDEGGEQLNTKEPEQTPEQELPQNPEGGIAIVTTDLSQVALGGAYIQNETTQTHDLEGLLARDVSAKQMGEGPRVLILHTHTSEGYLTENTGTVEGELEALLYTDRAEVSVVAVGEVLCRTLNQKGISAIHCSLAHDASGRLGSYATSLQTVRAYLAEYPEIEYVIDLHRDLILSADGALVRSEGTSGDARVAQVRLAVGAGEDEQRENDLALALQLQSLLNEGGASVCRPVLLEAAGERGDAAYELRLEIGTAANSPKEAELTAVIVGEALARLIQS